MTWYNWRVRWLVCIGMTLALGGCSKGETYFIPGTGTLPECTEAPATNLDGSCWFDRGIVTIGSVGCSDTEPDDTFQSCGLGWLFTQTGNDITILVDNEYRIEGRLCGDQLYLRGGWWLPVEDQGMCTYADDSAEEVGIQAEGNVLSFEAAGDLNPDRFSGVLAIQGPCSASYDVVLSPGGGCFFD